MSSQTYIYLTTYTLQCDCVRYQGLTDWDPAHVTHRPLPPLPRLAPGDSCNAPGVGAQRGRDLSSSDIFHRVSENIGTERTGGIFYTSFCRQCTVNCSECLQKVHLATVCPHATGGRLKPVKKSGTCGHCGAFRDLMRLHCFILQG